MLRLLLTYSAMVFWVATHCFFDAQLSASSRLRLMLACSTTFSVAVLMMWL